MLSSILADPSLHRIFKPVCPNSKGKYGIVTEDEGWNKEGCLSCNVLLNSFVCIMVATLCRHMNEMGR